MQMDWSAEWASVRERFSASRPFVTASFASSADGCLTAERGRPTRISCRATMVVAHQLRALHDALLVGVGTILADDPRLTTRHVEGRTPRRVVLDSMLRTPVTARLFDAHVEPPLLVTSHDAPAARAEALQARGAVLLRVAHVDSGVSLNEALAALGALGLRSVMVEGGGAVLDSFFSDGLVDFVVQTVAPMRLDGPHAHRLGAATGAALAEWRPQTLAIGRDRVALGPWRRPPPRS